MNRPSKLATAIKFGLIASVSTTAFTVSNTAFAEEVGADVERIAVTGSRIQRTDMETASPVTVIDASAIKASGATSIDEVLQKMTATGGAMTNPGVNNGSQGGASINLRGLGSQRTLVLVNNRRMVNSGTGAASTVDLNTIPVSMIKRVEVLKDGASSVYGSDAVAGVVNIILKDDFEGLELNVQSGISGQGDAEETSFDLTTGGNFDGGNVVMGIQYMKRGSASQADRGFSECPLTESGGELVCAGSVYSENGHLYGPDGDYQGNPDGSWDEYNHVEDAYNYSADSFLYTPMERLNFTALANFDLTDDTTLFTETMYSKRWSEQQMAPQPIYTEFKYTEAMGDSLLEHGINYGDDLGYARRLTEVGPREFSQVVDTARVVVGLEGMLDNGWTWDTSVNYGRNDSVDRLANLVNMGSLNEDITEGTFNPLDQTSWASDNMEGYTYTEQNTGGSEMLILSGNLSGEVMELPAGYLGFASGIEHRKEKAWFIPDSLTAQGLANDPKVDPTEGEYDVNEAYLELAIPLLADLPLAQQVDLSAAVRYFDYSTFGSDSTWKLGLTWKMTDDLMLRSVASTAFRAPSVDELYSGSATSFDKITHPVTGEKSYQAEVTRGGNENLTPEEAETFTVGFVYSPSYLDGFSVTADYYDISITNSIALVDSNYIAEQCMNSSGEQINKDTALCQSANITYDPLSGKIKFNNQLQNIGAEDTSGIDVNLAYTFEVLGLDWRTGLDTTILLENVSEISGQSIDYAGYITSGMGSFAKVKSNFDLGVQGADWSANYQARYISGMDSYDCQAADASCLAPTVGSVVYHDISGSYYFNNGLQLSLGVNNLFDKEPPYYSGNNDANTDPYTYDTLGRYFYLQASFKI
ncbi:MULTISPECIES: TonB-dependent receptor [unclassified Shewanella]|uniref:TonB-dependent receptor n=1 Tax=unclassified Shewanella TaxID=196818 RepID=UPI001BC51A5F|nr:MULTISPECIES: TonB-dependent receptor [unclassified Shewanella]GIU16186.1 TonB-dependent receptor [Shewanella sp. MBTL60-112-B1]GIU33741.1 TonB-dependent receptor [Shewanella sp. MBTL60-112-B2]